MITGQGQALRVAGAMRKRFKGLVDLASHADLILVFVSSFTGLCESWPVVDVVLCEGTHAVGAALRIQVKEKGLHEGLDKI